MLERKQYPDSTNYSYLGELEFVDLYIGSLYAHKNGRESVQKPIRKQRHGHKNHIPLVHHHFLAQTVLLRNIARGAATLRHVLELPVYLKHQEKTERHYG